MTARIKRLLAAISAGSALLLVLFLFNLDVVRDPLPPRDDIAAMAQWLVRHPADWLTSSAIAHIALDSALEQRVELWRAAHAHALMLAPLRPNTAAAFVRAGLFHWYELGERERRQVLETAAPLLRDPALFASLHVPLWQLTRDFAYLRRVAPDTVAALEALRRLAVSNGLFAEYRQLREELRRKRIDTFRARRETASIGDLLALLPDTIDAADKPLVGSILSELERRGFQPQHADGRVTSLIEYALRQELPVTAFASFVNAETVHPATRARLALALEDRDAATRLELVHAVARTPEWRAYYLDRARFEARERDAVAADVYLGKAGIDGDDATVLATAERVATLLDRPVAADTYRQRLRALEARPRQWRSTCGENELCTVARTQAHVSAADPTIRIDAETTQSDEVAPYLEIYLDGVLAAEGPVEGARTFAVEGAPGINDVEVRLVNQRTRNGVQRRVRLS